MTSNHHALYVLGYKLATIAGPNSCNWVTLRDSHKAGLSSDRSLQPDSVKLESLVIVSQNITVNTFPGFVHTACQTMKVHNT